MTESIKRHSMLTSISLHLAPGAATLCSQLLIVDWIVAAGFPPIFAWSVVINLLVFYPILFGSLFYLAKKRGNKGFSLEGVVVYRTRLNMGHHLKWAFIILLATTPLWFLLLPLAMQFEPWFWWVPRTDEAYEGDYEEGLIITVFIFNLLFTGLLSPFAEELYYRGYVLPRMPRQLGRATPIVHTFLFAVGHFHSPWLILSRTISLLPLVYVTQHTRSIIPGTISHQIANSYSLLAWAYARWS